MVPSKYVKSQELSLDDWIAVISKLKQWGIQHIKFLGGEPTQSPHILPLLRFLHEETDLEYLIISNSIFNTSMLRKLVDAGMYRYTTSVDGIDPLVQDDTALKSNRGLQALKVLQEWGLKNLAADVVISAVNVHQVHRTVEYLLTKGIGVTVCPVIVGSGEPYWEFRTNHGTRRSLAAVPKIHIEAMVERLLKLKEQYPDLFLSTEKYLRGILSHGVRLDWKCWLVNNTPPQLRIDSDGTLMLCPDIRGNLHLKVLELSEEDYKEYLETKWKYEVERYQCPGCYWSSMVLASERRVAY